MGSTTQQIKNFGDKYAELLHGIAELDYAPSALEQSSTYLLSLTKEKTEAEARLKKYLKKTNKEREEHLDLQKSITRKWANKLVGRGAKFEERASKEERCAVRG
jgi:hypothetical protein